MTTPIEVLEYVCPPAQRLSGCLAASDIPVDRDKANCLAVCALEHRDGRENGDPSSVFVAMDEFAFVPAFFGQYFNGGIAGVFGIFRLEQFDEPFADGVFLRPSIQLHSGLVPTLDHQFHVHRDDGIVHVLEQGRVVTRPLFGTGRTFGSVAHSVSRRQAVAAIGLVDR